jgi:hypothetical protein
MQMPNHAKYEKVRLHVRLKLLLGISEVEKLRTDTFPGNKLNTTPQNIKTIHSNKKWREVVRKLKITRGQLDKKDKESLRRMP